MATIDTDGSRAVNQARMTNNRVSQLHHPQAASAGDMRAFEDIVVDLIGNETPDLVRYGALDGDGGLVVQLVAVLPSGVIAGVAHLGTIDEPGTSSATKRRWSHVTSWGFIETKGYDKGTFSPAEDRPAQTTLTIAFDDGGEPLHLPMTRDQYALGFTYDELVDLVRVIEERCPGR